MITKNGLTVVIDDSKRNPKEVQEATIWAKQACDRIFSHYSEQELIDMRKRNQ